jgi:hypothetical protein
MLLLFDLQLLLGFIYSFLSCFFSSHLHTCFRLVATMTLGEGARLRVKYLINSVATEKNNTSDHHLDKFTFSLLLVESVR